MRPFKNSRRIEVLNVSVEIVYDDTDTFYRSFFIVRTVRESCEYAAGDSHSGCSSF